MKSLDMKGLSSDRLLQRTKMSALHIHTTIFITFYDVILLRVFKMEMFYSIIFHLQ